MTWFELFCLLFLAFVVFGTIFIGICVIIYDSISKRKLRRNRNRNCNNSCPYWEYRSMDRYNKNNEIIDDLIMCNMLDLF